MYSRNNGRRDSNTEQQRGRDRAMSLPAALHFNQEIAKYSKLKQYDLARASFERMIHAGVAPDVVTYNTMINVYVKSQNLKEAFVLFEDMKKQNISPTIITYTSLIDGCGKCNNFSQAMLLYQELRKSGIALNMHPFNAILNAGLLNGNMYIVDTVLADVAASNLCPNTVTFNTLLSGFSRFDQLARMKDVVRTMKKQGVEFSPVTQATLLQAAQLVHDQNDMRMFFDLLDTAQFSPTKNQASQAVMDLINSRRLVVAHGLLSTFLSRNCIVSEEVFGALCQLAGEFGNFLILQWTIDTARSCGIFLENDAAIARIDIQAKFGDATKAIEMYDSRGNDYKAVPGNTKLNLIDALLNSNNAKGAIHIVDHFLKDKQTYTKENGSKLLKMLSSRDMHDEVLRVFDTLSQGMLPIDSTGANCVVAAILKSEITYDRIDSILELHPSPHMLAQLARTLKPNLSAMIPWCEMACGTKAIPHISDAEDLISSLITNGQKEQAWTIFQYFVSCGVETSQSLISLAQKCTSNGKDFDRLMFLVHTAKDAEILIDSDLASASLLAALDCGNISEALAIKDYVDASKIQLNQEALDSIKKFFGTVKFAFPTPTPSVDMPVRPVGTRRRSSTCPRMKIPPPDDTLFPSPQLFAEDNDFI